MKLEPHAVHIYNSLFFDYIQSGSSRSAKVILPLLLAALPVRSVLDVGCGAGAWLREYAALGIDDCLGVDGDYLQPDKLLIPVARFLARDLTQAFDLGRHFDLIQCMEVAEHLPNASASVLVDTLTRHGQIVLFSAAVPGQGGEYHINEQPYSYWRDLFAARGYRLYDYLRSQLRGRSEVEPWYRYNSLLFVHDSRVPTLPPAIASSRIADDAPIPDISPLGYQLRKILFRRLPSAMLSRLAVFKHRLVTRPFRSTS